MNTYSLYDLATGIFTGGRIICGSEFLDQNIPPGIACVAGEYDELSERVDVATGVVIDYQPPQPSPSYVWDAGPRRWRYVKADDDLAAEARAIRDRLMSECDWVTLRAADDGTPIPAEWAGYRANLRNITSQPGFPGSVIWPSQPVK